MILSYAKLNLGLKVMGKRVDGFHDICSVFLEVDLADKLRIGSRSDGQILVTCSAPEVPDGNQNIAYRTAQALRHSVGNPDLGCEIAIEKRIPSGGGLGGGSSNAAAALIHLNGEWNLGLSREQLLKIAAGIGSDVPFFLTGGCAYVEGRGEYVQPVDFTGYPVIVLVNPGFMVSTPWAFGKLNIELTTESLYIRFLNSVRKSGEVDLHRLMKVVDNDFLDLISTRYPSVQRILSLLRDGGAECASMSGTGATLFGSFASDTDARGAADCLRDQGYVAHLCRPVGRVVRNNSAQ
jgi:4-diphosphocytidyl-2-C-methyl-D-erythritol kinase